MQIKRPGKKYLFWGDVAVNHPNPRPFAAEGDGRRRVVLWCLAEPSSTARSHPSPDRRHRDVGRAGREQLESRVPEQQHRLRQHPATSCATVSDSGPRVCSTRAGTTTANPLFPADMGRGALRRGSGLAARREQHRAIPEVVRACVSSTGMTPVAWTRPSGCFHEGVIADRAGGTW